MFKESLASKGIQIQSMGAAALIAAAAQEVLDAVKSTVETIPREEIPRQGMGALIALAKRMYRSREDLTISVDDAAKAVYARPSVLLGEREIREGKEALRQLLLAGLITVESQRVKFAHPALVPLLVSQALWEPFPFRLPEDDPSNLEAQVKLAKVALMHSAARGKEFDGLLKRLPHGGSLLGQ